MLKNFSAVAALSLTIANVSFAEQKVCDSHHYPSVLVGGEFGSELGSRIQDNKYTKVDSGIISGGSASNFTTKQGVTANNNNLGLDSFAAGHITIYNADSRNFSYGAHMGMKTTTRSNRFAGKGSLERSYVFLEGNDWGRLELGANEGVSRAMINKGKDFDAAEGSWDKYVSLNTYTPESNFQTQALNKSNFLTSARLVFQETKYETNHEAFRKVTYYTPKINGFQFGISYIPDATNKGGDATYPNQNDAQTAEEKNAFAAGVSWGKTIDKTSSLDISLVGETGPLHSASPSASAAQKGIFHKTKAFAIGAKYIKDKISIAAAYGNRFKSGFKKNLTNSSTGSNISPTDSFFINTGGAYQLTDKTSLSLTYLYTNNNKNTLNLSYLGVNYKIIEGCKVYGEAGYFTARQKRNYNASTSVITPNQNFKNAGVALITGIKFRF
ncbi:MAG: porin [Rickettsiales bacterium]|nr:porin [Rickettsiales bacterium]